MKWNPTSGVYDGRDETTHGDDADGPDAGAADESTDRVIDGLYGDVRDLQAEVEQLRAALTSRASIDQAKGILMHRYTLGPDAAFSILQRLSSSANLKLKVVAEIVVATATGDAEAVIAASSSPTDPETAPALQEEVRRLLGHDVSRPPSQRRPHLYLTSGSA